MMKHMDGSCLGTHGDALCYHRCGVPAPPKDLPLPTTPPSSHTPDFLLFILSFPPFLILLPPPFLPCWAIMENGRDCCRQPRAREGRRPLCNVVYDFSEEKHRLRLAQRNRLCLRAPVSLDCRQAECLNVLEGQGGQEGSSE